MWFHGRAGQHPVGTPDTGKGHNGVPPPHRATASLPPAARKATQLTGLRRIQARRLTGLEVGRPMRRGLAWAKEPLA